MRAFLRTTSSGAKEPASSVEQAAESGVPSSDEQSAETFASIEAVHRWLKARDAVSNTPELQRLRDAVVVLTRKPKPRKEEVFPLCSAWIVRRQERKNNRPLATLITQLQQASLFNATAFAADPRFRRPPAQAVVNSLQ